FERGRDRFGIAQRLRRHPILTISAVKIAAEHAEAVSQRSGISVEERLLLDGIALHASHVSEGDVEFAAAVEADFAYAGLAFGNRAAMSAGEATDAIAIKRLAEVGIGLADARIEEVAQSGHTSILRRCAR